MRDVRQVLDVHFETISAESLQEAQRRLHQERPDCVVVAYHFDEIQAFRFIRYIRDDARFDEVAIILVCVLPFKLGASEEEVCAAYQGFGVDQFLNLHEDAQQHGWAAALARLRGECVGCCATPHRGMPVAQRSP
jgi:CheY-like chemotaxis protein